MITDMEDSHRHARHLGGCYPIERTIATNPERGCFEIRPHSMRNM